MIVVLGGIFVAGDQFARSYAQNMIASKIQSSSGTSAKPSVTIQGWPFLTQVAEHDVRYHQQDAPTISDADYDALLAEQAQVKASGDTITVQAVNNGDLVSGFLNSLGSLSFKVPALPEGLQVTGVSVTQQGLRISAAAGHAQFRQ